MHTNIFGNRKYDLRSGNPLSKVALDILAVTSFVLTPWHILLQLLPAHATSMVTKREVSKTLMFSGNSGGRWLPEQLVFLVLLVTDGAKLSVIMLVYLNYL